ncbi:Anaphase-promoting complex subunit 4 [Microtus ochrogaster]|uniref:Anaphase-promoting complex subunit 4 n=1 Tax=Microtus ochrogaster TaxID=79684 RepID=A0A8J6G8C2_MICOH|nr:Anaphase-promoting complex subunit 4 [Microtus ochrogaster]
MASWKQKYEPLGLDATCIEDAITAVGSFILKANELLQVIDSSMKNFKAFFRWLYVAMLRMTEDHVLPELNKMTQKDITFVAEFLTEHFNEAPDLYNRKGKYFNVERVGQYLKDEDDDLVSPPNTEGNQWYDFLQGSSHLKDAQFYDDDTVTLILKDSMGREGRDRILVQLPLSLVYNSEDSEEYQFTGTYSTRLDEQGSIIPTRTLHLEKHWRLLESMKAQYVAGNGLRKVSCVLSSNLRHVRVFEMDIDDEWELEDSSDDDDEAGGKPMKIKEEELSESDTEEQQDAAALDPDIVIKVEKLDPELDS